MNMPNNKRKKESILRIEKIFLQMIQTKEINEIKVSDICKEAKINRTTFYANYTDIFDLTDKVKEKMFYEYIDFWKDEKDTGKHSYNYLKMFELIRENQLYFKTLMKLNLDFTKYYDINIERNEAIKFYGSDKYMDYHIEYFKAGMNAIINKWLNNNCQETPEEMAEIIRTEYQKKNTID